MSEVVKKPHLIELSKVSKFYKTAESVSTGMKEVDVAFDINEFVAVTGSSGSGKSTMLNVISGLDGYEEGEMYFKGEETSHFKIDDWERYRAAHIGFIFQNYNIIDSFTVLQNVMLALEIQNYPFKERKKRALELIEKVGLLSHKNHKASKLSGGQKQRTVIARALAKDSPIIVADEPTGNLDSKSAEDVMKLLSEISKDKLVIVVTHDYDILEPYATRKIKMVDGNIIEDKILKPHDISHVGVDLKLSKTNFLNILRFAFKNLLSQPKRFIFVLLLQIIIVGVLTIVYTGQVKSIRETELGAGSFFKMVPSTRMLIQRRDQTPLSQADIDYFNSLRDVDNAFLKGENLFNNLSTAYLASENAYGNQTTIKYTDHASRLKSHQVRGSLPSLLNEVVLSSDLNEWFDVGEFVYLQTSSNNYYLPFSENTEKETTPLFQGVKYKIVGFTGISEKTMYFSDAFINEHESVVIFDEVGFESKKNELENQMDIQFILNANTEYETNFWHNSSINHNGEGPPHLLSLYHKDEAIEGAVTVQIPFSYQNYYWNGNNTIVTSIEKTYDVKVVDNRSEIDKNLDPYFDIFVSQKIYDEFARDILEEIRPNYITIPEKVISLSISGYAAGNRLLNTIDSNTYRVFYPANIPSSIRPIMVFLQSIYTIIILSVAGMFLYTVLHAVTKNVMAARKKDFAIYRSIGANKTTLGKLVILEQVIISLVSLAVVLIIFNIGSFYFTYLQGITNYLLIYDYLYLTLIFMLFGMLLGMRFNKRVFNQTVIETLSLAKEDI